MHPIRLLADVHRYPPNHGAGAEWMLHHTLVKLIETGRFQATVSSAMECTVDELDGVTVLSQPDTHTLGRAWKQCDVAITHLDRTRHAMSYATTLRKPLVHFVHNDRQLAFWRVKPRNAALVVFNSHWIRDKNIADKVAHLMPSMVLHPYTPRADYQTTPGGKVTLVNLSEAKGAPLFWLLAEYLPDVQFLAVKGAYGQQIIPSLVPANVTVIDNTANMRDDVYAQTRLLLMPSSYESWGRCAMEAAASGIPTIAHPTPGLRESLGTSGLFIDRENVAEWVEQVHAYTDPAAVYWKTMSDRVKHRSEQVERLTLGQLEELATRLESLVK